MKLTFYNVAPYGSFNALTQTVAMWVQQQLECPDVKNYK